jgi:uncharacterized protein YqeY
MNDLYMRIKNERLSAKKAGDSATADTLTTLMSEIQRKVKPEDADDATVKKVGGKMVKDMGELVKVSNDGDRTAAIEREMAILSDYLPKQMTADELAEAVAAEIADGASNVGAVMKAMAMKHPGLYDGRDASRVAMEKLKN